MRIDHWLTSTFPDVAFAGSEAQVPCPFCADRKRHLYVALDKGVAHCFRCDWSGSWYDLVRQVSGVESYVEFLRQVQSPPVTVDQFLELVKDLRPDPAIPSPLVEMPNWFMPFDAVPPRYYRTDARLAAVLKYALRRASAENLSRHRFGVCMDPKERLWAWRMILPVEDGYYQARAIGAREPKYLNPKHNKAGVLFNTGALNVPDELIVAEGIFSALAIGPHAVALCAKRATHDQLERLAGCRASQVTVAFDAGTEFDRGTIELATFLGDRGKAVFLRRYASGDPDTCEAYEDVPYGDPLWNVAYSELFT